MSAAALFPLHDVALGRADALLLATNHLRLAHLAFVSDLELGADLDELAGEVRALRDRVAEASRRADAWARPSGMLRRA